LKNFDYFALFLNDFTNSVRHFICYLKKISKSYILYLRHPQSLVLIPTMNTKKEKIQEVDIHGFKYFKKLSHLLEHLHSAGCQRDKAQNRILHMDQYVTLLLLCMFSPISKSLRSMQQAGELQKVQKKLGVPRSSLGSLSEAARVFDSSLIIDIIEELAAEVKPIAQNGRLKDIKEILTIVDGTLLTALPKTVDALWKDENHKAYKSHIQYEILKGVPTMSTLTNGNASEKQVLAQNLQPGRLYVLDRGYAKYALLQQIIDAGSNFVCRVNDSARYEIIQQRQLTIEDIAAGISQDITVKLGCQPVEESLHQSVRLIELKVIERTQYSAVKIKYSDKEKSPETMLIATDRMDLSADMIALIYKYRWQIEIFFRFFKHVLGCRHLLSYSENGVELQIYAAIIACLMLALYTGRKPTLRTYEMFCWYLSGWASEEELMTHIAKLGQQQVV
jgi:hypothetical protein